MNILSLFLLLALSPALQARSNLRALNLDPNLLHTFPAQSCTEPGTDNACKSLLKNYCEKLDANNGTVTDSFGTIKRGASARSQLSEAERSDLSQLAQSFDALPEDLKPALRAPYTRLQQALEREQDSREWYREISNIRGEISLQVGHLASARAAAALEQRLPPGKRPTERDIEAEDRHQTGLLMDQITAAKISSGPHWTRIQEVFVKVKADMRRVIEALPLTSEERTQRLQAIDATELSFPLPIRAGSGRLAEVLNKDCRSTMNNANYFAVNGKISICAGLANQFTTENTLYFVLSHELAHSFNAGILASRHPLPTDPAEKMITRLIETNSTLDCGEWNQLKTAAMTPTATPNCSSSRYQGLVSCLNTAGTSSIKDSESAESGQVKSLFEAVPFCQLTEKAEGLAYMNPTEFSNRHSAAMLSQLSGGAEYVGPDLEGFGRFFPVAYHITQQLRCNENMSCQQVIAEVQANSYPAPACETEAGVVSENEADWYAHKAVLLRLREFPDLEQRRDFVAGSMSFFCGYEYNYFSEDQQEDLIELEDELTELMFGGGSSGHADSSDRLLGILTTEMADTLQCVAPPTLTREQSYQGCRL